LQSGRYLEYREDGEERDVVEKYHFIRAWDYEEK
jgi:hypothetical protein